MNLPSPTEFETAALAWMGSIGVVAVALGALWKFKIWPLIKEIRDDLHGVKAQQEVNKINIASVNDAQPNTIPLMPPAVTGTGDGKTIDPTADPKSLGPIFPAQPKP